MTEVADRGYSPPFCPKICLDYVLRNLALVSKKGRYATLTATAHRPPPRPYRRTRPLADRRSMRDRGLDFRRRARSRLARPGRKSKAFIASKRRRRRLKTGRSPKRALASMSAAKACLKSSTPTARGRRSGSTPITRNFRSETRPSTGRRERGAPPVRPAGARSAAHPRRVPVPRHSSSTRLPAADSDRGSGAGARRRRRGARISSRPGRRRCAPPRLAFVDARLYRPHRALARRARRSGACPRRKPRPAGLDAAERASVAARSRRARRRLCARCKAAFRRAARSR